MTWTFLSSGSVVLKKGPYRKKEEADDLIKIWRRHLPLGMQVNPIELVLSLAGRTAEVEADIRCA